jgi:hypothetical protein
VIAMVRSAVEAAPSVAARVKEDVALYSELRRENKGKKAGAKASESRPLEAAAE